MGKIVDIAGQRFGRLVAIKLLPRDRSVKSRNRHWLCRCDCGNEYVTTGNALRKGMTKTCGCTRVERARELGKSVTTHGQSRRGNIGLEYSSWRSMISRCYSPRCNGYHNYGGRGIEVCDRWRDSFEAFLADMGPRPTSEHSIDRIDWDGHYEPGNCRWATRSEQQKHKRIFNSGERNGQSRLTEKDVRQIRARYYGHGVSVEELAAEYGLSAGGMLLVVKRRRWKGVPPTPEELSVVG